MWRPEFGAVGSQAGFKANSAAFPSFMTWGKVLSFSVPQFLHV